jgi:hypothetical protein
LSHCSIISLLIFFVHNIFKGDKDIIQVRNSRAIEQVNSHEINMKKFTIIFAFLFSGLAFNDVSAQVGVGFVFGGDYYQWYRNPEIAGLTPLPSTGNVLLNVAGGPKLWFGGDNFSLSLEAHLNWGITAFDMHEYKGMGNLAFPIMAKLNFGGISGFGEEDTKGLYIGAGMQYARTEAYGLTADYVNNTTRDFFRTWIAEIGYGSGGEGISSTTFVRFGLGYEEDSFNNAMTLNVGSIIDFNISEFLKFVDSEEKNEDDKIQSFLDF